MTSGPARTGGHVAASGFHLLAKPTGAICNLDCTYCFLLSKELLYPGSRFRMADDLLAAYVRQLMEAHIGAPEVTFAWQGGEPTLMGIEFFRRALGYQRRYARPGQRVVNTIQTNGTLIDDEWGRFFRENDFLVGISIDGPRRLHDAYRIDKGGKPTFDRVMAGLAHLRRHGVEWNALTTVHAANAEHGRRVYRFLRDDCGAAFIQFIPIIERAAASSTAVAAPAREPGTHARPLYVQSGTEVADRSVTAEGFGRFLIDVFEEWVRRDVGRVYVQMFDVALAKSGAMEPTPSPTTSTTRPDPTQPCVGGMRARTKSRGFEPTSDAALPAGGLAGLERGPVSGQVATAHVRAPRPHRAPRPASYIGSPCRGSAQSPGYRRPGAVVAPGRSLA